MATLFSRIIAGEIPCHKIAENDQFIAFLDISPLTMGHALVVPKIEIDYIFDMEDRLLGEMMIFAKRVAIAIKKAVPCPKVGVAVIGLEVPHCHVHLSPLQSVSDLNFSKQKLQPSPESLKAMAELIAGYFE